MASPHVSPDSFGGTVARITHRSSEYGGRHESGSSEWSVDRGSTDSHSSPGEGSKRFIGNRRDTGRLPSESGCTAEFAGGFARSGSQRVTPDPFATGQHALGSGHSDPPLRVRMDRRGQVNTSTRADAPSGRNVPGAPPGECAPWAPSTGRRLLRPSGRASRTPWRRRTGAPGHHPA
jgi:hypothetical protein